MPHLSSEHMQEIFTAVSELLDRQHLDLHADDRAMLEGAHKLLRESKDNIASDDLQQAAFSEYGSDECEIDDDAATSPGDGGTWVAAWVWIADSDECGQCEGTGTTQSASNGESEECPVCDGTGEA